ncbi:hypothetical protein Tel_13415 [Candidatus Tenderia electrophaga]|uniref:histidine kinase n=1 Tax=Candidatus Tenderia electrophaga TaxID=1748243 RepID=A0A0S2TFV7_9GAMM|nr:hypothetical protein Tel_13415 [Candidatus Tenderia electrophaga]
MKSLLARLGLGLGLGLVAVFVLQWWVVNTAVRTLTQDYVVSRLEHDADSLLARIAFTSDGRVHFDTQRDEAIYHMPFSGHYYLVQSGTQQLRSRSLWDEDFPVYAARGEPQYVSGPNDQWLLLIVREFSKQGHPLRIVVAENMTPLLQQLHDFGQRYALVSVVLMVLVMLLLALLAKRSLRPLGLVIEDVKRLELGEITRLREAVPSEVHPLVKEFNRLLQVMQDRLERSRSALGNLAHALKTPLTVLVRLEDEEVVRQNPQLARRLQEQTGAMRQIIDRQLKRARLAGISTPGLSFDPGREFDGLVDILRQIYSERGLEFELRIPQHKTFAGDREDMLELFGNLLDNACKWARRRVRVTVPDRAGLTVTVEDDGPGCAPELRQQLDQRGRRLDEGTAGHGLGLAIVRDIVEHYQGSLVFGQSEDLGGFRVDVVLPGRA